MAYCPNGHDYNAALHDSCPECAKSAGKTVLNAAEIKSGDVISIGTTRLMFVALCGEAFGWDAGGHA